MTKLKDNTLYLGWDRFVCNAPSCAGSTARATGRTIDGVELIKVTRQVVTQWQEGDAAPEPLECQCGRLKVSTPDDVDRLG